MEVVVPNESSGLRRTVLSSKLGLAVHAYKAQVDRRRWEKPPVLYDYKTDG